MAAAGIVAGLIALGVWLAGLLPGLGLGPGGGSGIGLGKTAANDSQRKTTPKVEPKKPPIEQPDVVEVRVDGKRLLLKEVRDGKATYRPLSLRDIVALARKAPGNARGVKVRIDVIVTADLDTLDRLKSALQQSGLKRDQIDELKEDFR
jgi:hypothetical protein